MNNATSVYAKAQMDEMVEQAQSLREAVKDMRRKSDEADYDPFMSGMAAGIEMALKSLKLMDDIVSLAAKFPTIVCLCGSTRFFETFQEANRIETLAGNIVLTIGCDTKSDDDLFRSKSDQEKQEIKEMLDKLHLRKIDLCDEVLILNVGGYIGQSTQRELDYARFLGKPIRFWESEAA